MKIVIHGRTARIHLNLARSYRLKLLLASCECIISSSLHGLIIADSYCVPNKRVILTNRVSGDGFKFHDYYSSFGLTDKPIDLNIVSRIEPNAIIDNYKISKDMIEKKQEEIIVAFKKFL